MKELKSCYSIRSYLEKAIRKQVNKRRKWCTISGYKANFKDLNFLIRKDLRFLYADTKTKRIFTIAPFISI